MEEYDYNKTLCGSGWCETLALAHAANPEIAKVMAVLPTHVLRTAFIVTPENNPGLYGKYTELCRKIGVQKIPLLFVTRRKKDGFGAYYHFHAIRVATQSRFGKSGAEKQEFVLGHELLHAKRKQDHQDSNAQKKSFAEKALDICAHTSACILSSGLSLVFTIPKLCASKLNTRLAARQEERDADIAGARATGHYDASVEYFEDMLSECSREWQRIIPALPRVVEAFVIAEDWLNSLMDYHPSDRKRIKTLRKDQHLQREINSSTPSFK